MFEREITVTAAIENLEAVTAFVDECLEQCGCSPRIQMQMDIAVDEIFSNISYYAYSPGTGSATIKVSQEPCCIRITFMDAGIPFDPLSQTDPDTTLSVEERKIGGLGIYMVKKTMDAVSYEYRGGRNILRIQKNL